MKSTEVRQGSGKEICLVLTHIGTIIEVPTLESVMGTLTTAMEKFGPILVAFRADAYAYF